MKAKELKPCCATTLKSYSKATWSHPADKLQEDVRCNRCDALIALPLVQAAQRGEFI